MRVEQFEAWLNHHYIGARGQSLAATAIRSRVSNCRSIDSYEGDLDEHFEADGMVELNARLTYCTADQRVALAPRHAIPIDGDIRTGTATLKSAMTLYRMFCSAWPRGTSQPTAPPRPKTDQPASPIRRRVKSIAWPTWPQPTEIETLALARIAMPYVRFLKPDIVASIVEDNERERERWRPALSDRGIQPDAYLWQRSPCAFPGVRRYAGSREVAIYRGHLTGAAATFEQALRLDDNDCPKHIWSFVLCATQFQKHGPPGYALAHLADHKSHGNRFTEDFDFAGSTSRTDLFGLYSCPTNAAYIPSSMIKPTDFGKSMRNLLLRRVQALYGKHCNLTPDWLRVPAAISADWNLDNFQWAATVGDVAGVGTFLDYRSDTIEDLLGQVSEAPAY